MSRSKLVISFVSMLLLVGCGKKGAPAKAAAADASEKEKKVLYWFDPMKPEVHFNHPGKSPFMDMQLEPKYAEEASAPAGAALPAGYSVVKIPLERRQEIGVTTAKVEKRSIGGEISTNGIIA